MFTWILMGLGAVVFWVVCSGLVYPSALRHLVDNCPFSTHETTKFNRVGNKPTNVDDELFHRPDARTKAAWGPILILFYFGKFFNGESKIERNQRRQIQAAEHMKELAQIRLEESELVKQALENNLKSNPLNV